MANFFFSIIEFFLGTKKDRLLYAEWVWVKNRHGKPGWGMVVGRYRGEDPNQEYYQVNVGEEIETEVRSNLIKLHQ